MGALGLLNQATPAQRCVQLSGALTVLVIALVVLLFAFPIVWLREAEWTLFILFLATTGGATVLAFAAVVVRGAKEAVAASIALIGLNLITFLGVIVALFNFRMGAP